MDAWLWPVAMVCLLPLLAAGSPMRLAGVHIPWGKRGRTWLVLFCAGFAGTLFAAELIFAFAAIDGVAAAMVLKRPRGEAQRAIGLLFVGMLFVHLGFYLACRMQPGPHDFTVYAQINRLLGWLQWACLLSWGVGYAVARRAGAGLVDRDSVPDRAGAR